MIAVVRWMAGISVAVMLAGCPPSPHSAWIDPASTAEAVIIRYAADRAGHRPVALLRLDVYRCTVEGVITPEKAIWSIQRTAASRDSTTAIAARDTAGSLTYGQAPTGFTELRPPTPLDATGCYFALLSSNAAKDPGYELTRTASVGWEMVVGGGVREVSDDEMWKRFGSARAERREPGV